MGKEMNRRRRILFNKLRMEGKLDRPLIVPKQDRKRQPRQRCRGCRNFRDMSGFNALGYCPSCAEEQVQEREAAAAQCCVGSLSRLPDGVVSCPDCPLTNPS